VNERKERKMIELDGSSGEGGGQILRTALALSMCTGQPIVIHDIRAKRAKPGLMRQHLACVQAAVAVSGARAEGAELGSRSLRFEPALVRAGDYRFSVGTAGSCTLVLQTVLPALMLADGPSTVTVGGGTHNPLAPPFHFLERSFAPLLRRAGVGIDLELRRMGFYPAGGGEFTARVQPAGGGALLPVNVTERGNLLEEFAECLAPALPARVAARELEAVGQALGWAREQLRLPTVRQNEGPGNALMATLRFEHVTEVFTAVGEKGVSAERVADLVVRQVRAYRSAPGALGPHLADQWMLPLALATARSARGASFTCTELTEHARTNMDTISAFLPIRFSANAADGMWRVAVSSIEKTDQAKRLVA
jgi:RNA 3'-terminal phosphate cyclase (ATP)